MEIPGYYYDESLRRYFKIPPAGERERYGIGNGRKKEEDQKKEIIKKDRNIPHTVPLLRDRACCAAADTSNIHNQLSEGVLRRLTKVGCVCPFPYPNPSRRESTIESIKFNESRQVLSVIIFHGSAFYNFYFTSANGEHDCEVHFFKSGVSPHMDNTWDFQERTDLNHLITKYSIIRLHPHNQSVTLFNWLYEKNVSSVSWDRLSSADNSPIALLGYEDGTFKRIDRHGMLLSNDTLFTSKAAVNDIVSFNESMTVGGGSNGSVCFYDHRSNQKAMKLRVPSVGKRRSRIVKLHPLSNGEQIVTSSMNSKMLLWDLRFMDVLISFPEHKNSHSFTSSLLDPQENFLAAVNDSRDVIFWSLASGRVIHQLHPENPVFRPKIAYASQLGNPNTGLPTLFVAQDEEITLYSLKDSMNFRVECCKTIHYLHQV